MQSHPSLPARPPPPASSNNATAAALPFKPRSVAAPPVPSYSASRSYSAQPSYHSGYSQPPPVYTPQSSYTSHDTVGGYPQPAASHDVNPFASTSPNSIGRPGLSKEDQEFQAQIAQWQSAYTNNNESNKDRPAGEIKAKKPIDTSEKDLKPENDDEKKTTVMRSGGGQNWHDTSLLEWDPSHFRLFVGNLAGEVSDDSLLKAFQKYESVQKARVVRDKRTTKSKGFGFVSFSNMDDYSRAAKEMQGKYIGSHPVILRAAKTDVRPSTVPEKNKGKGGKGRGGGSGGGAQTGSGVKKQKQKGGLKILG